MSTLEGYGRLYELFDELGVDWPPLRREMLDEPERALRVLEHARTAPGIKNPAAYAAARWKTGYGREAPPPEPEPEPAAAGPPTLSAIEHAWSRRHGGVMMDELLAAMGAAVQRHGGFEKALKPTFAYRDRYDDDGELIYRRSALPDDS